MSSLSFFFHFKKYLKRMKIIKWDMKSIAIKRNETKNNCFELLKKNIWLGYDLLNLKSRK